MFGVTVVAFFLAEMGDKTQVATVMLAARFASLAAVVIGTTLGMLIANVPVVLLGKRGVDADSVQGDPHRRGAAVRRLGVWVLAPGLPAGERDPAG